MKRYKVKITDTNVFRKEYPDGTYVFGSYGEPVVLNLLLNNLEKGELESCIIRFGYNTALYAFTHGKHCTEHHKRQIWKHFREICNLSIVFS